MELRNGATALAAQTFVLEDDTGSLTLYDVRGPAGHRFRPLRPDGENVGFSESAHWLRFRVKNTTTSSSFLVDLGTAPTVCELYDEAGTVTRSGASLPFGERGVMHPNIAFRVELHTGQDTTF